jgi:serine/threonine protein kinase
MKLDKGTLLRQGDRIGVNLIVLDVIDGGAKEPVYIVWHQGLWCPLACKIFPSYESATREAAILAEFSHPFIVRIFGVEQPGCLLMPFLEGRTLAGMIDDAPKNRLSVSDALRVAIHIGSALLHIHERGFLHLDIKPGNIIVTPGGRPVLFDFGTARRLEAPRPSDVTGTNAYIAPEECRLGNTGPAADVFSLAVTLFEMLTGEMPFGREEETGPFPQTIREPTPPRVLRKSIPEDLENLIVACLEHNPDYRPTLQEIIPVLNSFITHGPGMWPVDFDPARGKFTRKGSPRNGRVLRQSTRSQTLGSSDESRPIELVKSSVDRQGTSESSRVVGFPL